MTVKDMKKLIENMPDDREILLSCYNRSTGGTFLRYVNQCCNQTHQESKNELWLSNEGLIKT